jgi:aldehyde:ferredoxin oxidoreductase
MQVKGVELPRQEPRSLKEFGLTHATSNRGADHMYGLPTISAGKRYDLAKRFFDPHLIEAMMGGRNWRGKAEVVTWGEPYHALCDSLGIFNRANSEKNILLPEDYVAPFTHLTGFRVSLEELVEAGERIINLERAFNVREFGVERRHDKLPPRFLHEPLVLPGIDDQGSVVELDKMLDRYYELHGWSSNGRPTIQTLHRLGLEDIAEDLKNSIA